MKNRFLATAACAALALPTLGFAQFEAFKDKVKPGLYEYKMDMDMGQVPGMPPGMGKQSHTMKRCVTQEDVDKGSMGGDRSRMPALASQSRRGFRPDEGTVRSLTAHPSGSPCGPGSRAPRGSGRS